MDLKIFTTNTSIPNGECGNLSVGYTPTDATGNGDPPEDLLDVEDIKQMLGREIYFNVNIDKAINLPMELCTNVYVEYIFKHEPEAVYRTPVFDGKNPNPVWNYKNLHSVDCLNDYILDYFNSGNIVFKTYGNPAFGGNITPSKAAPAQRAITGGAQGAAAASYSQGASGNVQMGGGSADNPSAPMAYDGAK
jgi:hypothetical protein